MKTFLYSVFFSIIALLSFSNVALANRAEQLKQVEDYFNKINTIQSDFYQVSNNGAVAEGKFYASKPNKMRLEYADQPIEVVADGYYLIFHDKKLGQVTYLSLDDNPASMILKKDFAFDKEDLDVTKIVDADGLLSVTVLKKQNPTAGKITLIFTKKPFILKQWQVTDAQQVTTLVSLNNMQTNVDVDDALFDFKDPKKDKNKRRSR